MIQHTTHRRRILPLPSTLSKLANRLMTLGNNTETLHCHSASEHHRLLGTVTVHASFWLAFFPFLLCTSWNPYLSGRSLRLIFKVLIESVSAYRPGESAAQEKGSQPQANGAGSTVCLCLASGCPLLKACVLCFFQDLVLPIKSPQPSPRSISASTNPSCLRKSHQRPLSHYFSHEPLHWDFSSA